jgi:hypothetical protein
MNEIGDAMRGTLAPPSEKSSVSKQSDQRLADPLTRPTVPDSHTPPDKYQSIKLVSGTLCPRAQEGNFFGVLS